MGAVMMADKKTLFVPLVDRATHNNNNPACYMYGCTCNILANYAGYSVSINNAEEHFVPLMAM